MLLGDFWDCYSISKYDKNPEKTFHFLEDELAEGRELLDQIERRTKAKKFTFLCGNHEARVPTYMATYAKILYNIKGTKEILGIPNHWKFLPYGQGGHYQCGKLLVTHGTLFGKHVAATMVQKYMCSVLFGHVHRIQEFQIRRYDGKIHRGITCGWLGDMKRAAEFVKDTADWCHGFAIGYFKPNGDFFLQVIPIINYEAMFNGRVYTAAK